MTFRETRESSTRVVAFGGLWAHYFYATALLPNAEHSKYCSPAEWIQCGAELHLQITQLLCNAPPAPTSRLFFPSLSSSLVSSHHHHHHHPLLLPASPLHQSVKCITCSKKKKKKGRP